MIDEFGDNEDSAFFESSGEAYRDTVLPLSKGTEQKTIEAPKQTLSSQDIVSIFSGRAPAGSAPPPPAAAEPGKTVLSSKDIVNIFSGRMPTQEEPVAAPPKEPGLDIGGSLAKGWKMAMVTWDVLANRLEKAVTGEEKDTKDILAKSAAELAKMQSDPRIAELVQLGDKAESTPEAIRDMLWYAVKNPTMIANFVAEQIPAAAVGGVVGGVATAPLKSMVAGAATRVGASEAVAGVLGKGVIGAGANAGAVVTQSLGSNYVDGLSKYNGDTEAASEYAVKKTMAEVPANALAGAFVGLAPFASKVANIGLQGTIQGAGGVAGAYQSAKAVGEEASRGELILEFLGEFALAPMDIMISKFGDKNKTEDQNRKDILDRMNVPEGRKEIWDALNADPKVAQVLKDVGLESPADPNFDDAVAKVMDITRVKEAIEQIGPKPAEEVQAERRERQAEVNAAFKDTASTGVGVGVGTPVEGVIRRDSVQVDEQNRQVTPIRDKADQVLIPNEDGVSTPAVSGEDIAAAQEGFKPLSGTTIGATPWANRFLNARQAQANMDLLQTGNELEAKLEAHRKGGNVFDKEALSAARTQLNDLRVRFGLPRITKWKQAIQPIFPDLSGQDVQIRQGKRSKEAGGGDFFFLESRPLPAGAVKAERVQTKTPAPATPATPAAPASTVGVPSASQVPSGQAQTPAQPGATVSTMPSTASSAEVTTTPTTPVSTGAATQPTTAPAALPRGLAGAKPRYSIGPNQFDLDFESDLDKAAFITSQSNKSKRDGDYRAWLRSQGLSDTEIASRGQAVRERIKAQATGKQSGRLTIPVDKTTGGTNAAQEGKQQQGGEQQREGTGQRVQEGGRKDRQRKAAKPEARSEDSRGGGAQESRQGSLDLRRVIDDDLETVDELNRKAQSLLDADKGEVFRAVRVPVGDLVGKIPGLGLIQKAAKLFGKEVVFFRVEEGKAFFDGAVIRGGKKIFVNVNSTKPHIRIVGHELVHALRRTNPAAYDRLADSLQPMLDEKGFAGYTELQKSEGVETADKILEEAIGDIVGDRFGESEFWQMLADRNPTGFRQFAREVINFIDNLLKKIGVNTLGSETLVKDLQSARREIARILGEAAPGTADGNGSGMDLARKRESDAGHKREKESGRYVGAPDWVGNSPQQLVNLRKKLKQLAQEGTPGRYWYEQSSKAILELAGGDKAEAERIVALIAIYSPNATVPANTSMALRAYYQHKAGLPIKAGLGDGNRKAEQLLRENKMWSGIKTNSFYQNLMIEINPSRLEEGVATMDMWMAIAFDYGMKTLDQGPKYKFAQREIQRLAKELGWTAHQTQAAIWTAMKGRVDPIRDQLKQEELRLGIGEMVEKVDEKTGKTKSAYVVKPERKYEHFRLAHKMGMDYDLKQKDIEESKYDFSDAIRERTAQMSWEATPGAKTGVLPGLLKAPMDQKFEYLRAVSEVLTDKDGIDVIAKRIGLPSGKTFFGFSAWDGDIGAGAQTLTGVAMEGVGDKRDVTPEARSLLNLYAAIKGYVLNQEAVVWHVPTHNGAKKNQNGYEAKFNRALTEDEMSALYTALHAEFGIWDIAPGYTEDGFRLLNFDVDNKVFQEGLARALGTLPSDFGGGLVDAVFYRSVGDYISNDWINSPNGEGYVRQIESATIQDSGTGSSDLQAWTADLRSRVQAVNQRFSEKYDWGNPGTTAKAGEVTQQTPPEGGVSVSDPDIALSRVRDERSVAEIIKEDIPNETWLNEQVEYAKRRGRNEFGVPYMGKRTGSFAEIALPVSLLSELKGERGEQTRVRKDDLAAIKKIMQETGKLPLGRDGKEYIPYVEVAYNGEAWVSEGNHRIMAAKELGWDTLPVEIRYFDGGQRKDGPLKPEKILALSEESNDISLSRARVAQAVSSASVPGAFAQAVRDRVASAILPSGEQRFNWWHKSIGTQLEKARVNPYFRKVYDLGQKFLDDTAMFAMRAQAAAPTILPNLGNMGLRFWKGGISKANNELLGKMLAEGTLLNGPSPMNGKIWTDAELRSRYNATDEQIKLYREARAAIDQSLDDTTKALMGQMARSGGLAQSAIDPLMEAQLPLSVVRDRMVRALQALPPTGKVQTAINSLKKMATETEAMKKGGYAPLMRFGEFVVSVENAKGEIEYFSLHETAAEALRTRNEISKQFTGPGFKVSNPGAKLNSARFKMFAGLSPSTLEAFFNAVPVTSKAEENLRQEYLQLVVSNRSALARMIQRKGTAGYNLDATRTLASFITSNSRHASKALNMAEISRAITEIPQEQGDVAEEAVKLQEYLQNPQEGVPGIRGFLFFNFLGGSIAAGLVNMTQPVLMTYPYLTQWGAARAGSAMTAAMKNATAHLLKKSTGNAALDAALKKAAERGITQPQEMFQLIAAAESGTSSLLGHKFMRVWGLNFAVSEVFNRVVTFTAAFNLGSTLSQAELQKAGVKDAFEFAVRTVEDTQGKYNKGNRPNWARETGVLGSAGTLMFTFKQYSIAYMEFLKQLYKNDSNGKKALGVALATLILAAGLSGLPGADDLDDIIDTVGNWLGYPTNSKKWKSKFMTESLGMSPQAANFLLYGVSAYLPMDLQARLGLANLIPGTGLLNPTRENKAREVLDVAGPLGGFAANASEALEMAGKGNYRGAGLKLAPKAARDAYMGMEMASTGKIKDEKGRMVQEATPTDAVVRGIGFNPQSVASASRVERMIRADIDIVNSKKDELHDMMARSIVDKDPDLRVKAMEELRRWNSGDPEYRIMLDTKAIEARINKMLMDRSQRFAQQAPKSMRARVMQELQQEKATRN